MKTTPYHHGALKEALIAAAEAILRRDGLNALTLRAAAREAGVSHAAPSHHFGDLTGLLTELAASGFQRFGDQLRTARAAADSKRWDGARAYMAFAQENPALFQLMFRSDRLDGSNPIFREARVKALSVLADVHQAPVMQPSLEQLGAMLSGWSLIHGYTLLLLDGRLTPVLGIAPEGTTPENLLEAVLSAADKRRIAPPDGA
ncbi:AcrR family transcriptional regulator [Luteibacter sp. Sphag1AF]|uniref:TetR/AcrR family transcriptional regulator n=1 Tax=Luteibacter sp. Sphag1AF TaxID=2587031 RepID=UPI00160ED862|nr:TetR/AcrR family transcriptional regulator [Luteibacter sp. Sphag1AF]MBB3228233.1 AcrR family transcriptional regulator [Luteibacter sp. Sphag1AF]